MEKKIRIIDKRAKEKFLMDDVYLNGYAKTCGWKATIVYISLCRHVSKDQFCFPSIKLIAGEHNVSNHTVIDGLKILEEWNIISISKERRKNGTWLNNSYILLDKSIWKSNQVNDMHMDNQVNASTIPCERGALVHVNVVHTKETHGEGNTSKETHTAPPTESPFVWNNYLQEMDNNKRIDLQLIGYFFRRRKLSFNSKKEVEIAIHRHLRAAKDVSVFGKDKVFKAMDECDYLEKQKGIKWTLETCLKMLTK